MYKEFSVRKAWGLFCKCGVVVVGFWK